ncbi:MAG: hypothetical protein KDD94_11605 [Calditrichaeota bacterium]|nr:hypothetical protein [Calditrichota bacterium]
MKYYKLYYCGNYYDVIVDYTDTITEINPRLDWVIGRNVNSLTLMNFRVENTRLISDRHGNPINEDELF